MPGSINSGDGCGPAIRAVDPWLPGIAADVEPRQLLSRDERARLARIASIVRFKKGAEIFSQGAKADAVFNIISGVVKSYKSEPGGGQYISSFLFADDLFGLSEQGRYENSTRAITPVTLYRLPVAALRGQLAKDSKLDFNVICKLCHEIRQAQRHAFLLAHRGALSKLALFLQLIEFLQAENKTAEIYLPMSRSDISDYVGMTLAAVSRAFRALTTRGIIKVRDRRHVKIVNRVGFEKIAGGTEDTF